MTCLYPKCDCPERSRDNRPGKPVCRPYDDSFAKDNAKWGGPIRITNKPTYDPWPAIRFLTLSPSFRKTCVVDPGELALVIVQAFEAGRNSMALETLTKMEQQAKVTEKPSLWRTNCNNGNITTKRSFRDVLDALDKTFQDIKDHGNVGKVLSVDIDNQTIVYTTIAEKPAPQPLQSMWILRRALRYGSEYIGPFAHLGEAINRALSDIRQNGDKKGKITNVVDRTIYYNIYEDDR